MKPKFTLSLLTLTTIVVGTQNAIAQPYIPSDRIPVADNTLGTQVSGAGGNFDITGGVSKGQTLFHSFTDFSVPTSGQANFLNPLGNRDIITRVTGNLFSDINGLVNTNGANFFLINPSGIVFGPNAQLNVGKAFVGSTANSIDLVGGGQTVTFGTNPNGDAPLLSVAPNVLFDVARLNLGGGSGAISNFGTLQTTNLNQYIGLIAGNVTLDGGKIVSSGGRVELGGLSAVGTASLGPDINNLRVQFSPNVARGDVSLTNGAKLDVTGAGGGDVAITGQNVAISGKSAIGSGIGAGLGTQASVAGDININATGNLVMGGGLNNLIFNDVGLNSIGQGGNVIINAGAVSLSNGAQIGSSTLGQGNAGNIKITTINGVSAIENSVISSTVEPGGVGNAGNIDILASSLSLKDVGQLQTINRETDGTQPAGRGNAGNITVKVTGSVDIAGNRNGLNSGILSFVSTGTVGNAGNIRIEARSISLTDGAKIKASTSGQGNGGNIDIKTTGDISISGSTPQSTTPITATSPLSSIFADTFGKGNAGKITIDTQNQGKLLLSNRGSISSLIGLKAVGNSGDINISAQEIDLRNQSSISASNVGGTGDAGNIDIKTTGDISISGSTPESTTPITSGSPISSIESFTNGQGNAGKITINTQDKGKILLSNKGRISNFISPIGIGNGQTITILANGIDLKNQGGISSDNFGGQGNAGNINIKTTGDIKASNLSPIASSTSGRGNAGAITIDTQGKISFSSVSGINTGISANAVGNGANITISAEAVNLNDRGLIVSINSGGRGDTGNINVKTKGAIEISNTSGILNSNSGQGKTGNISLDNDRQVVLDKSFIQATSSDGTGGNIEINNRDRLLLRNTSNISTNSGSSAKNGNGGNIEISSPLIITPPGNNDIAADANGGTGGQLNITSQGLFGIQFRDKGQDSLTTNDITASSTFGRNGNVNIDTPGTDPGKDSTELPNVTTDASNQISQACSASNRQNKLTVTGRGGLPPNANDPLTSDVIWQDARAASPQPVASNVKTNLAKIVAPAVGWIFNGKGKVTLVAAATQGQPTGTSVVCPQTK